MVKYAKKVHTHNQKAEIKCSILDIGSKYIPYTNVEV